MDTPDPYQWHRVAEHVAELDFTSGNIALADVNGKKVCIGRSGERLFAFAWKCPHAGARLSEGHIDALGQVVCPLHRYKFNPLNGRNSSGEGYYLKHWPVEIREGAVYIGLDRK
jgi:3-phenylpropionate/trans-cinnamate dioxygenase ferredoxin subunit